MKFLFFAENGTPCVEFFSRKSYTVCKTLLAECGNPNGDEERGRRGTQQGMEMKRRIALVTAGWKRMITTAWSTGLIAYIRDHELDVSVEWFHSWEGASQNPDFRHGEDNIFTLPEFDGYDGIVVDLVNMESAADPGERGACGCTLPGCERNVLYQREGLRGNPEVCSSPV